MTLKTACGVVVSGRCLWLTGLMFLSLETMAAEIARAGLPTFVHPQSPRRLEHAAPGAPSL